MLNIARAAGYARQRDIQYTAGDTENEEWVSELLPRLTGPQRRRIRHSMNARIAHEHEKGVRCLTCKPAPREAPAAWRKPDAELLDQL